MDWFKQRLEEDIKRGDRNLAMASALGAYNAAIKQHDWKILTEIRDIVDEVIFNNGK